MIAIASSLFNALIGTAGAQERAANRRDKLHHLIGKYHDRGLAEMIFRGEVWEGQTESQLLDSMGAPSCVNHGLPVSTASEVWNYGPRRSNRYRLRVKLEDGLVIDWEQ